MRDILNLGNILMRLKITITSYKIVSLFALLWTIATFYLSLTAMKYNSYGLSFILWKWQRITQ